MLVLFDLDGTLTDPYRGISGGLLHAFSQMGFPRPTEAQLRSMIGPPFQESFPSLGVATHQIEQTIAHYRSVYNDGGLFDADVYPGIPQVLEHLVDVGHSLALATSKPAYMAERILEHFELRQWFAFVGGGAADGTRHHKHEVIEHVLANVASKPGQTVMVGDRSFDIEGARVHALPCISVRWGYASRGEIEALSPDGVVDHPHELPATLSRIVQPIMA